MCEREIEQKKRRGYERRREREMRGEERRGEKRREGEREGRRGERERDREREREREIRPGTLGQSAQLSVAGVSCSQNARQFSGTHWFACPASRSAPAGGPRVA